MHFPLQGATIHLGASSPAFISILILLREHSHRFQSTKFGFRQQVRGISRWVLWCFMKFLASRGCQSRVVVWSKTRAVLVSGNLKTLQRFETSLIGTLRKENHVQLTSTGPLVDFEPKGSLAQELKPCNNMYHMQLVRKYTKTARSTWCSYGDRKSVV